MARKSNSNSKSSSSTRTRKSSGNSSSPSNRGRMTTSSRSSNGASAGNSKRGRSASQKVEKYRFAQNVLGEASAAEREYREYVSDGDGMSNPDLLLSVPVIKVDRIHLELESLDAAVALKAKVLDLVGLTVGVDAHLGKLRLDIEGVEAQALAKVRLDRVAAVVDRVLTAIDRNPELVENLGAAVEHIGSGAGETLDESGEGVEHVGEGAKEAVGESG
jgi:hypothetical protein